MEFPISAGRAGLVLALACITLAGCAGSADPGAPDQARLASDRYALAHGMALGFITSGHATGMDLLQVIHLDRTALAALAQGSDSDAASNALVDYVTRRELDGQPAPTTVPPEFIPAPPKPGATPTPPTAPLPPAASRLPGS